MQDTASLSPARITVGVLSALLAVALLGGAVIGVTAGVGAVWHATNPPAAGPARAGAVATAPQAAGVTLTIKDVSTPEGSEPAYVGPSGTIGAPVLFDVKAGITTTVTIVNKSQVPHTFTSSALGVNVTVPPGPSTVHFSVDPKKPGKVTWHCAFPCGAWVMSHSGYMQGLVEVES